MDNRDIAKLMTTSIMGEDYRASKISVLTQLLRRIKKCLPGY